MVTNYIVTATMFIIIMLTMLYQDLYIVIKVIFGDYNSNN